MHIVLAHTALLIPSLLANKSSSRHFSQLNQVHWLAHHRNSSKANQWQDGALLEHLQVVELQEQDGGWAKCP